MREAASFLILLLFLRWAPAGAAANGDITQDLNPEGTLQRFTQSITGMYVAVETCQDIVPSGPEIFVPVKNYLNGYYPGGIPYWVLPDVKERSKSLNYCAITLGQQLMNYQRASVDFAYNHPENPPPPEVRYAWTTENAQQGPTLHVVPLFIK
jgi:hypothetical protein